MVSGFSVGRVKTRFRVCLASLWGGFVGLVYVCFEIGLGLVWAKNQVGLGLVWGCCRSAIPLPHLYLFLTFKPKILGRHGEKMLVEVRL